MKILRAGLIGENISRTRLPAALEIMCNMNGISLEFELIDTAQNKDFDFAACVDDLRAQGWTGVSVTHPFKTEAAAYAGNGLDGNLALIGASNLLIFGDRLRGTNTDFSGAGAMLDSAPIGVLGNVTMIGAGGVARALAPAIRARQSKGAVLFVHDTNAENARLLCDTVGMARIPVSREQLPMALARSAGLVNATPIGMAEHPGTPFDPALMNSALWAFDAIYTPPKTQFLEDAEAAGLTIISGFELFRHMALDTFAAYTGITPDPTSTLPKLARLRPQ